MITTIEKLRADRKTARLEINRRFPSYAGLVDPKAPTVDEIKAALRPGEALLSFYFGQDSSFVWAVPKEGPVAMAAVPATAIDLEANVRRLRQALEPQITMVSESRPSMSRSRTSSMECCSNRSKLLGRLRKA